MRHKCRVKRWWWVLTVLWLGMMAVILVEWRGQYREHSQDRPILAAARRYGVQPALVKAVVWRESYFDPHAYGRAKEVGLMQIRTAAAQEWARAERLPTVSSEALFDPVTNTLAGTWYLGKLLKRYARADNPAPYALADYNAGRSNVLRWIKGAAATNSSLFLTQMDFPGTRRYLSAILDRRSYYVTRFP